MVWPIIRSSAVAIPGILAVVACGGTSEPAEPEGPQCIAPTAGMVITGDTVLCSGTHKLAASPTAPAISIEASDLTLRCEPDTVIEGTAGFGSSAEPLIGIGVVEQANVTVIGCSARGFTYGMTAIDVQNLVLEDVHLDDNFTDPAADWVQDTVQGGGIRLERVVGGEIRDSSFARNWNGLELRGARELRISGAVADHCSNTGLTLADAHDNVIEDGDFSWGIRGEDLAFPGRWYGIDTKDSAGVIVDAGSSGNVFSGNDFSYGGDGIFVRSIIGGCATDNVFENNDTSYSPHNAIECWCDRNQFIGNDASNSHYGIWLGGTDHGVVRGNIVDWSVVDGISIQIGEDRHTIIEDNKINNSGRVGLLLTGKEYQAWHTLDHWADRLANSSHLVVQNNDFSKNVQGDIFVSATRSLILASNCGDGGENPGLTLETGAELVSTISDCGAGEGREAPTVALTASSMLAAGESASFVATDVQTQGGAEASFTWLVQPSAMQFPSLVPPETVVAAEPGAQKEWNVDITEPGVYDVDVTVDDGYLAGMANTQLFVAPTGTQIGVDAADWELSCGGTCVSSLVQEGGLEGGSSIGFRTNAAADFYAVVPKSRELGLSTAGLDHIGFFVRGKNNNGRGWQGNYPQVTLGGPSGSKTTYTPASQLLSTDGSEWLYVEISLDGDSAWTREGPPPTTVQWIEIHADTWGYGEVELWIDKLTLY